jgi:uncharacterized 2Fe-2S/4Fe-4S cluster protein (DUF4445 family)
MQKPGPMKDLVRIELLPLDTILHIERGNRLQDVLFAHGVEFPCGGRGRCKGCKIKLLEGSLPITSEEQLKFTKTELADGWRLACCQNAETDLRIELAQWEAAILADDSEFDFKPAAGFGIAIDLGTTTIVAQLIDLKTGHVLAVQTALNSQAQHGADIMSRIEFALTADGQEVLEKQIRNQIRGLVAELFKAVHRAADQLRRIVLVGNTAMHHLFSGLSVEPLSHLPFESPISGLQRFTAGELGWSLPDNTPVHVLPCLGGFVGSDILAGILATKLHQSATLLALLDLGTNGEIVVGNRDRILCASTAAGPAFEGARISMGMRASTGAISEVHLQNGELACHVLGNSAPRGICGSGLVDAVAAGLDLGWIKPNGRLTNGNSIPLASPVELNQRDIRELQLAKGAIAAGLGLLLERWGASRADLRHVFLAGAFGNYINQASARRIGLLDFSPEKVRPVGNTALLGAKLALFDWDEHCGEYPELLSRITHFSLHENDRFQEAFVREMAFPDVV